MGLQGGSDAGASSRACVRRRVAGRRARGGVERSSADRPSARAASRGLPKRTLAKVRRVVQRFKQTNGTPGVLIDIWGPKGSYVKAKGAADLATGERLGERMQFKAASQTKSFTATLILRRPSRPRAELFRRGDASGLHSGPARP